jgi:hypothetical protein
MRLDCTKNNATAPNPSPALRQVLTVPLDLNREFSEACVRIGGTRRWRRRHEAAANPFET